MGQFYAALNISKKQAMFSGLKFMELAWNDSFFVNSLIGMMAEDWSGDDVYLVGNLATLREWGSRELRWIPTIRRAYETLGISPDATQDDQENEPLHLTEYAYNNFEKITDKQEKVAAERGTRMRYIINQATGSYIDLQHCPIEKVSFRWDEPHSIAFDRVHPLPLLIAVGSGRGMGDFQGNNRHTSYWVSTSRFIRFAEDGQEKSLDGLLEWRPNFTERQTTVFWSEKLEDALETINSLLRTPATKHNNSDKAFLYEIEHSLRHTPAPPPEHCGTDQDMALFLLKNNAVPLPLEIISCCCDMSLDEVRKLASAHAQGRYPSLMPKKHSNFTGDTP